MAECPCCGHKFVARDSIAALALNAIGDGDSNVDYIKSQMPAETTDKEIYNALGYLVRKGIAIRLSYGLYRKTPTQR